MCNLVMMGFVSERCGHDLVETRYSSAAEEGDPVTSGLGNAVAAELTRVDPSSVDTHASAGISRE